MVNTAGQVVLETEFEGDETELDITGLCSGLYVVLLENTATHHPENPKGLI